MKKNGMARVLGHTAIVALLTVPAFAQDTVDLAEITVEADTGTGAVTGTNPATLTGAKTATPLTEVPQSVSVIAAANIEQTNARKVDEVLAYTAGVQAAPYGYDSDTNWFFVRGLAATATGAFVDGMQNYSYGFGGFYIDPYMLERIEVLRGASSALYGGSNPGGLVNMVTKRPTGEDKRILETGVDSDSGAWTALDLNGHEETYDWRFVARVAETDGNGAFAEGFRGFVAPSVAFKTAGGTDVTLSTSYMNIDETHVGNAWLPYTGTVEAASFGYIARDFNTGEPGYDWYDREQFTVSAEVSDTIAGGWTLTNATRFGYADVSEGSVYAYGYAGYAATPTDAANSLQRVIFDHDTTTRQWTNDTRVENTFALGGTEHHVMAGLDLRWFEMDQVQSAAAWPDAATLLSATDPVYGATQPSTSPYADNVITQTQAGLYVQDQMRFGNGWIATGNLRNDWIDTTVSEDRTSGAAGAERSDSEASWRFALAKEMPHGVTGYVSASSYFLPQVETSSAGSTISPETGRQIELGAKWAPTQTTFFGVSAFQIERQGIVQSSWNGAGYDYTQLGEVTSSGIEVEGTHDFGNGLTAKLALTKMDVEITNDTNAALIGKTPYATIEDQASLSASWTPAFAPDLTLTGGVRHMGASWADNANTQKVPAVTLYDVSASYDITEDWSANLAVTNLADTTYVAACQTNLSCFYGDGRTVSLAVRHAF